jgi:hypothetical protein
MTIREALLSLNYREARPGKWAKPVGFHLFTFSEEFGVWRNWFKDAEGRISVWESHAKTPEFDGEQFSRELRTWEAYTKTSVYPSIEADFHLTAFDL